MVNAGKVSGAHALRPIPTEADWSMMQNAYRKIKKDTDPDDVYLYKAFDASDNGFKVPIDVKYAPGKGRGVFAKQMIPKGAKVNEARCGLFYTEEQWRGFLTSIPQDWAKDCCDWAYVETKHGKPAVWLDFCEAALMNHAPLAPPRWKALLCCLVRKPLVSPDGHPIDENANLDEELHEGRWCSYATRDIQAGEELLCDYEDFHNYKEPLEWFEATWDEYWESSSSRSSSNSSSSSN